MARQHQNPTSRISTVCFAVLFITLGGIFFFSTAMLIIGALHGDHIGTTISGPPSLDSPFLPDWVHRSPVVAPHALPITLTFLALGLVTLFLSPKPTSPRQQ